MTEDQLNALKKWVDVRIAWMIADDKGEFVNNPFYDSRPFIEYEKEFDKIMLT